MISKIKNRYYGPALILLSHISSIISHILVKYASSIFTVQQIMLIRFLIPTLLLSPLFMLKIFKLKIKKPVLIILRSITGLTAMYLFYKALTLSGPGKVNIIFQLCVVWSSIISMIFLKERPSRWILTAIATSFIGIFLILKPENIFSFEKADILSLTASLCLGIVIILIKKLREDHDSISIIYVFFLISTTILILPSIPEFILPNSVSSILTLTFIGFFSLLAQLFITVGFKYTSITIAGSLGLVSIPLMYIAGLILFSERIDLISITGTIIVTASLYIIIKKQ
ncbi:MAG: DMT family transporter [bacterium]|nr:DMT family transporter [bacterium]